MTELIKFLLGESDYKGAWFGDSDPDEQTSGKFWWRKLLRKETESAQSEIATLLKHNESLLSTITRNEETIKKMEGLIVRLYQELYPVKPT